MVTVGGTKSYDCKVPVNYIFHKELQIIGSTVPPSTILK